MPGGRLTLCLEGVSRGGVAGVDLELENGSLTVLLGPTGAGKTSLLRLLAGLDKPAAGRVRQDGVDVHRVSPRKRQVGFVHQRFVNYPAKTVYENIAAPLRQTRGLPTSEIDAKVRATAELLRIDGLLGRRPSELSGGQQQRTALARALVREGGLLLLDEPLVNLDYKLREELGAELRAIFARRSATLVFATSDPSEALALGGRTLVLDGGRVLQAGPALDVYRRPDSVRVGELTSVPPMNRLAGRLAAGMLLLGPGSQASRPSHLEALPDGAYHFGVRPHQLRLVPGASGSLKLTAAVELAELSGSETFLHVRPSEAGQTVLVVHQAGTRPRSIGENVDVFIDPRQLHAFDEAGGLVAASEL
ncbi:MAG: ABC transporter ATP-binding protein [bacterium]|nr:ABC transporter ATP-binding protein [bacterium]MCP5066904.1 ABC transporter ATP-binding protein [bacterium]